jgi:hypothetical protein
LEHSPEARTYHHVIRIQDNRHPLETPANIVLATSTFDHLDRAKSIFFDVELDLDPFSTRRF